MYYSLGGTKPLDWTHSAKIMMLKVELDVVVTFLNDIEGLTNNLVSHRVASLAPSLSFLSPIACLFGHELKAFSRDDMVRARKPEFDLGDSVFFLFPREGE